MNQTSSVVTGGVTITAATLAPLVHWALDGFPKPIPDTVPFLLAAAIVTGMHLAANIYNSRKQSTSPSTPITKDAS